jgi:hypothetical protein
MSIIVMVVLIYDCHKHIDLMYHLILCSLDIDDSVM